MIGSVSGSFFSAAAQPRKGDRLIIEKAAVAAQGQSREGGAVVENFKTAVAARLERYQRAGRGGDSSPETAADLVDSLAQAAAEVKDLMGQETANAFMAKVIKGLDVHGFSLEGLSDSVGLALQDIGQASAGYEVKKLTESFNRELGLEDTKEGRSVKSLSRAIGDFFATEEALKEGPKNFGFDRNGYWLEMDLPTDEEGSLFCSGTPGSAQLALKSSASFTTDQLSSDTVIDLANFLRNELGATEAADLLENQSGAGFMDVMDKVIVRALEESADSGAAARLESYLNNNVRGEINAMSAVNRNQYGYVEFEGWNFNKSDPNDFSSSWRYTNRDDVTYVRESLSPEKKIQKQNEGYVGLSPAELYERLEEHAPSGELLDNVV